MGSAIRLEPELPQPHYGLGTAYVRKGGRSEAMEQYKWLKDPGLPCWPGVYSIESTAGGRMTKTQEVIRKEANNRGWGLM